MQSKTLPEGVCNFPIRMTTEERAVWGRFTFEMNAETGGNSSIGDVMRRALALGAETMDTALAESVKAARRHRAAAKHGLLLLLAIGILWQTLDGSANARSFRARGRRQDEVAVEWLEMEEA